MEFGALFNVVLGVGTIVVSAAVAAVVGRRRGLEQVDQRADNEIKRLVDAQAQRLAILESENQRMRVEVATLTQTVATLRAELDVEKRITARIRGVEGG